ncbi:MAG: sensor domain-containing diguanylate cyclase [Thermoleophilia bacterium]|nr:sensor domain-containing diguanylate cyclase [Thermoleophilia bacterium]
MKRRSHATHGGNPLATAVPTYDDGVTGHGSPEGTPIFVSGLSSGAVRLLLSSPVPGAGPVDAARPQARPGALFGHRDSPAVWLVSDATLFEEGEDLPHRSHPGRPIVIALITGTGGDVAARAAVEAGADDVLSPPFGPAELRARLATAVRVATTARVAAEAQEELRRREEAMRVLSLEQGGLRRVTMAIASGTPLSEVFHLVAREIVAVLDCDAAHVAMRERNGRATVVGVCRRDDALRADLGTHLDHTESATARAITEGRPVRVSEYAPDGLPAAFGWGAGVAVPITVRGEVWGAMGLVRVTPGPPPSGAVRRLTRFAEIVALGIGNAETSAETRRLVVRDHLTGLFNRKQFEESLAGEVSQGRRHGYPVSVAMLDIDHFKAINDTHGHPVGDAVLVEIARRFTRCARAGETVARIGGEEFALVFPRTSADGAAAAAERVRAAVESAPFDVVGRVTVSIGVAEAAGEPEGALCRADAALYASKTGGRNRVTVYREPAA